MRKPLKYGAAGGVLHLYVQNGEAEREDDDPQKVVFDTLTLALTLG